MENTRKKITTATKKNNPDETAPFILTAEEWADFMKLERDILAKLDLIKGYSSDIENRLFDIDNTLSEIESHVNTIELNQ